MKIIKLYLSILSSIFIMITFGILAIHTGYYTPGYLIFSLLLLGVSLLGAKTTEDKIKIFKRAKLIKESRIENKKD
ncbi:MAG: hypothetical protein SLAVMIC_00352 [uncultured marine phage]|uniref:Uncharacterized protein n=1 Tax=uncultured marine phage TaxID=707152 RepID=A0A8D9CCW8_9VIRU|nr:MAG: hypothetical protein SLAVMIC_00352 [uncultured marine phage]